ncbi:helix-turn-helix domain-containing protein [Nocardioides bruguierae]|uniref:Helix-turn-helix domain-containing protein n=1 Tax=Nocardioides bruguierae TaxID=2945102 RepID=A0A9X2DAT0_9ACTN|nr:helix-turn-helix domain-containing protein [Nocardioides bruguierae]MCM0622496.1 helix-turn-helix domain-containing protein [Nocardioides bruguierae]
MTTSQAAEHFGIPSGRIREWRAAGRIRPVGIIPGRGRGGMVPLYRPADLQPLVDQYRDYVTRRSQRNA